MLIYSSPSLNRRSTIVFFAAKDSLLKMGEPGETTRQNGKLNLDVLEATSDSIAIRRYMEVVTGQATSAFKFASTGFRVGRG